MSMTEFITAPHPSQLATVLFEETQARVNSWYLKLSPWVMERSHSQKLGILSLVPGIPLTHWVSLGKSLGLSEP